jgi:hypothetical protein
VSGKIDDVSGQLAYHQGVVAQPVRAFGSHPKGHRFESCQLHPNVIDEKGSLACPSEVPIVNRDEGGFESSIDHKQGYCLVQTVTGLPVRSPDTESGRRRVRILSTPPVLLA